MPVSGPRFKSEVHVRISDLGLEVQSTGAFCFVEGTGHLFGIIKIVFETRFLTTV